MGAFGRPMVAPTGRNVTVPKRYCPFANAPIPTMSFQFRAATWESPGETLDFPTRGMNGTALYRSLWVFRNRYLVPGDSHVARLPRNDIFFSVFRISLPLCNRNVGGGGTPPPYEYVVALYRRDGGPVPYGGRSVNETKGGSRPSPTVFCFLDALRRG